MTTLSMRTCTAFFRPDTNIMLMTQKDTLYSESAKPEIVTIRNDHITNEGLFSYPARHEDPIISKESFQE